MLQRFSSLRACGPNQVVKSQVTFSHDQGFGADASQGKHRQWVDQMRIDAVRKVELRNRVVRWQR